MVMDEIWIPAAKRPRKERKVAKRPRKERTVAKRPRKQRGSIDLLKKLPPEIWGEIGKRLQSRLDVVRFRSVCQTWRSSLPPPSRFPLRVAPPPCDPNLKHLPNLDLRHCLISELTYYAVNQMVVVFEEVGKGGNFSCFATVPEEQFYENLPPPRSMEISSLSFLCNAYRLNGVYSHRDKDNGAGDIFGNRVAMKTVIISSDPANYSVNPNYSRVSDLTVVAHLIEGRKLAVLRLPNSNWETDFCSSPFEDIINYRGRLYAVDRSGSGFVMDYTSLQMTKVAAALPRPPRTRLIKTLHLAVGVGGDLYLVNYYPRNCEGMLELYKLSWRDQKWIQVELPDDRVFFLNLHCNFGVATDLLPQNGLPSICNWANFPSRPLHEDLNNESKRPFGFRVCDLPWIVGTFLPGRNRK